MNRQADRECQDYFNPGRSVTVYVQAPRQMGKSSLMQRIAYLTKQTEKFEIAYTLVSGKKSVKGRVCDGDEHHCPWVNGRKRHSFFEVQDQSRLSLEN
jgi:hypothetical protein